MVTANIYDEEWSGFTNWCKTQRVKYHIVYNYNDAVLIRIPSWYFLKWLEASK